MRRCNMSFKTADVIHILYVNWNIFTQNDTCQRYLCTFDCHLLMSKLSKQEHAFAFQSKLNVKESKCINLWRICNSDVWVICCLTSTSRRSAVFSSELPGWMSFLSKPPWTLRAWLAPAIAMIRVRRVTTAAVSMIFQLGRIADCYRSLQMMLFKQKRASSWAWFEFSLCGALARFIGGSQLSGSYIHLEVTSLKPPQRAQEIYYCTKGNKGPDGGKIWDLAGPFDRALVMTGSLGALLWSPQGGPTQLSQLLNR